MSAERSERLVCQDTNGLSPAAFRELYETNFDFIWNMLVRFGVRKSDALDQAQQVFLAAYLRFESFEGRSEVRTWLVGISRHVASDYRRSARYRHELLCWTIDLDLLFELGLFQSAGVNEVDGDASHPATKRLAETVLDKLPEPQRVVFVLYELEELQGSEIAKLLDVSIGTVRSRLRHARLAFAREVKRLAARVARQRDIRSGVPPRSSACH
jgi:RNA polymerase sigma-70 factor, ECF subfamily